MRQAFKPFLHNVKSLVALHVAVDDFLRQYQPDRLDRRFGYVAGIVTSAGPEKVASNLVRLDQELCQILAKH